MINSSISGENCFVGLTACGLVRVCFPFDAVTNAQLAKIRPRGILYGNSRGWEFPLAAGKQLKETLGNRFVIKEDFLSWLNWLEKPLPDFPSIENLLKNADFSSQLSDGRHIFPHQKLGAKWLLSRSRALLADEMGLGKTLTALLAARAVNRTSSVSVKVIAPAGVHQHWLDEANALDMKIVLCSWARIPQELSDTGTLLIVDEAHFAQSINSKRTKALLRLARHPRLSGLWMLTGTPLKNGRPYQLYPLLAAMNHPIASNQDSFKRKFCNPHPKNKHDYSLWNSRGASNLDALGLAIQPLVLYRKKNKELKLPDKLRKIYEVELSFLEQKGFEYRIKLALDSYLQRVREGLVQKNAESLVLLTALRKISSEFKLLSVNNLLKRLGPDTPVVLFSSFVEPLKLLQNTCNGYLLTGNQKITERDHLVKRFQKGEINLLLATYSSGGIGYTLHRARNVILLERPWSPGELEQAEDRCHRLGMKGNLTSHWFQLGFADQLIDSLLISKKENIKTLFQERVLEIESKPISTMINNFINKIHDLNIP